MASDACGIRTLRTEHLLISTLDLAGTWRLSFTDHQRFGRPQWAEQETVEPHRFIDAQVPGEVHLDCQRAGLISDPYVGLGYLQARWVEEMEWSYRRAFDAPPAALATGARVWLVCECLDLVARVMLNGQEVGKHANSFLPARIELTGKLKAGRNLLVVHLDGGLYEVADKPNAPFGHGGDSKLHKRHWLRKPQCQFGWDWSPRLINVGIQGPIRLEWTDAPVRLERAVPLVELDESLARGTVTVRAHLEGLGASPAPVSVRARLLDPAGKEVARAEGSGTCAPGAQVLEAKLALERPQLWWPVGHGGQPLYTIETTLASGATEIARSSARVGFRQVRVDQSPHPEGGRFFCFLVNGRRIFCKGGNYIPADIIRAAIDERRYQGLIDRALEANFNLLRVWGGGLYESDAFYRLCDERGILVWQEFIFACSRYPGTDEAFWNSVKAEAIWNIRRLAEHPSLIAWCGNNEIEQGYWEWGYDKNGAVLPDHAIYHHLLPRLLRAEDPTRFYQPSSPYSLDQASPTDFKTGDQHPWALGFGDTDFRKYRGFDCRFPNEGGFLGPNALATIREALPEGSRTTTSMEWQAHDNSICSWGNPSPTDAMIPQHLGRDLRAMPLEEAVYWMGLIQGEALREYCDAFRRRMFSTSSAIFWMYNDCWPCTRSWTIVDHRLRYTPCFHPVRRALAPVHLVLAEDGDQIAVFGVNDTQEAVAGELRYGLFALAGGWPLDEKKQVTLAPNAATRLASFPRARWADPKATLAAAMLTRGDTLLARNRLVLPLHKELAWAKPQPTVAVADGVATFHSPTYAWGVCLDLEGDVRLADNYFDLYPGVPYRIPWTGRAAPRIVRVGNLA